jgi:hypothetical protein
MTSRRPLARASARLLAVLVAATVGGCASTDEASTPATASEPLDMEAYEAAAAEYGTPGPRHEALASRAGTWELDISFWFSPDDAPERAEGVSVVESSWDGRYLIEHMESTIMGQPFWGMGVTGYDNFKKKYVATWIDSMSTGIMRQEGALAPDGSIRYEGESPDYARRGYKTVRSVEIVDTPDQRRYQMFDRTPEGVEFKTMEIRYRRQR